MCRFACESANCSEAAQTTVVMMSVKLGVTDGTSYNDTYITGGVVRVPDLSSVWHYNYDKGKYDSADQDLDSPGSQSTAQITMHSFGQSGYDTLSPALDCGRYDITTDILNTSTPKIDYRYYCRRTPEHEEFAYRFKEYNTDDLQGIYPHFTNRYITASSGPCIVYNVSSTTTNQRGDALVWT